MTSAKEYRDRLLLLADFLDQLPPERFDFRHWVGSDWEGDPELSCGTTACALGWATTIPEFRKLGLSMCKPREEDLRGYVTLNGRQDSWAAGKEIFGIGAASFDYLFIPHGGEDGLEEEASAKQVAARIRRFVEVNRWPNDERE
jgi:hypothetical protein